MSEWRKIGTLVMLLILLWIGSNMVMRYWEEGEGAPTGMKQTHGPYTIPEPYYIRAEPWPDHSIFGVEKLIGMGMTVPYRENYFDCSEMAAFLEWKLERYGFDSKICVNSTHAWVAVDISGKRYYIEPTAINVGGFIFTTIKPYDGRYASYANYDRIYEDIYEATRYDTFSEFDWWNEPALKHWLQLSRNS
ncbi:MAG TPA: hypothetical protein PLW12_04660 [Methanothrix sp.]|nr:hypothetical protein [Methanothrix sp.]HOK58010.1 hypothetical protein [Methanothrix sp.]HPO88569.1 hypothetical protein [Methanothrix sp.]